MEASYERDKNLEEVSRGMVVKKLVNFYGNFVLLQINDSWSVEILRYCVVGFEMFKWEFCGGQKCLSEEKGKQV